MPASSTTLDDAVTWHVRDHVGTLTLNRPNERNAMSPELLTSFAARVEDALESDVRVVILTGTGNVMLGFLDLAAGFRDLAWPGVVSGLGMGLFFVPMSTLAFQNIGPDRQDEASGIYGVTRSIGGSVGIAIVGWQVSSRLQSTGRFCPPGSRPSTMPRAPFSRRWV